jgi:predicted nucleic acid-binding protein
VSVVLDSSAVVVMYDTAEPCHEQTADWLALVDDDLVTTPLAVSEMDHLVPRRGGVEARKHLWRDLDAGAISVRWWADALEETVRIARRRPDLGLVDASLVALAHRLRTDRIATFDLRHFRTVKTRAGKPFTILPVDA